MDEHYKFCCWQEFDKYVAAKQSQDHPSWARERDEISKMPSKTPEDVARKAARSKKYAECAAMRNGLARFGYSKARMDFDSWRHYE